MVLDFGGNLFGEKGRDVVDIFKDNLISDRQEQLTYIFNNGKTQDANAANFSAVMQIGSGLMVDVDWAGSMIEVEIFNASGANDAYSYTLVNTTKGTTLDTATNASILDGKQRNKEIWIEDGKNSINDVITLTITDGVLGTTAGETYQGFVVLRIRDFVRTKGNLSSATSYGGAGHSP
jgi:uncharacterized protein YuzE